jgi:hypothetical protein
MKKITFILNCIATVIKKKFFNSQKTDISHDCKKALEQIDEIKTIEELQLTDEYTMKYSSTTRWQTL